ncbi:MULTISPECIES: hypothetical protein [Bacillus]|uniref:hypothetical protein n=1 Tax=Bacillus TaxID=1386 RepID=UPI000CFD792B|nr:MULTISPECIES: hypothetical protein [Bacillus]PRD06730.1 hypothetical protein CQ058_29495 [Bacillus sp. MYb56]WJE61156.1 hypothetical protein QRE64_27945 [Bacillus mycoides]
MSKQKQREQYNWNFKKEKNSKFHDWLDEQSNISESLITLVLHFVDQYGINDVTDYEVSKQMQRDLFMKEKFYQDISALLNSPNVNSVSRNQYKESTVEAMENEVETEESEKPNEKIDKKAIAQNKSESMEKKPIDDDYLKDVDESVLFGE